MRKRSNKGRSPDPAAGRKTEKMFPQTSGSSKTKGGHGRGYSRTGILDRTAVGEPQLRGKTGVGKQHQGYGLYAYGEKKRIQLTVARSKRDGMVDFKPHSYCTTAQGQGMKKEAFFRSISNISPKKRGGTKLPYDLNKAHQRVYYGSNGGGEVGYLL